MASRVALVLSVALALTLACAKGAKSPKQPVDPCPDSQKCLTSPECTFDEARQCEMCRCSAPPFVRPEQQDVRSPPP
jgi:hypothetical protein